MKKATLLTLAAMALMASCQKTEDEKAASLMNKIDSLYKAGNYQATLNAITRLRANHPKAVESREKALKIWQDLAEDDASRDRPNRLGAASHDSAIRSGERPLQEKHAPREARLAAGAL